MPESARAVSVGGSFHLAQAHTQTDRMSREVAVEPFPGAADRAEVGGAPGAFQAGLEPLVSLLCHLSASESGSTAQGQEPAPGQAWGHSAWRRHSRLLSRTQARPLSRKASLPSEKSNCGFLQEPPP